MSRRLLAVVLLVAGLALVLREGSRPLADSGVGLIDGAGVPLNSAGVEELEALPGLGERRAQALVAGRPYDAVADIERVKGIGPATRGDLEPWLRLD